MNNLPPGVTMADIDGPPMPRCFVCGGEHNDDDRNGICPDCHPNDGGDDNPPDVAAFDAAHADKLTGEQFAKKWLAENPGGDCPCERAGEWGHKPGCLYATNPADISNFNAAVADFDALTNYHFDRVDPCDIALWMRESWGERNTFYITFCLLAKRLGYEV